MPQSSASIETVNVEHSRFPTDSSSIILFVKSAGGLKMREAPDLKSKTLTVIPDGSPVIFFEETGDEFDVDGTKGKFLKISYKGETGYSFSGFIDTGVDKEKTSGYRILTQTSGPGKYDYLTFTNPNEPNPDPERCNAMYASTHCFYRVYAKNDVFILDSRDYMDSSDPYPWKEWINDDQVQLDRSFADDGCGYTRKAKFDVKRKSIVDIIQNEECSRRN